MKKLKVLDAGGDNVVNKSDQWGNCNWDEKETKKVKIDIEPYKRAVNNGVSS